MPYYQTVSYTTTGTKQSINLDPSIAPFNAIVACTLVAGSVSYTMQFSLTPFNVPDSEAHWFDSVDIPAGTATSATSQLNSPVSRIRFVIASLTTGPLTVEVNQGLSSN